MNNTSKEMFQDTNFVLNRTKFYIFITLQISAVLISLFIFVFFYKHRTQLKTPQNQALLVLLIVAFIQLTVDLPMPIHFFYYGRVIPGTPGYCTWWTFIEFSLNLISELLMATFSLQRHILIFQSHLLNNRCKRYLLHFLPLTISIIYPLIVYTCIILLYPCDGAQWLYSMNVCGLTACYVVYNKFLALYDILIHNNLPIYIIILANVILIIRVVNEKRHLRRQMTWKQHSRMALQLLAASSIFLISWLPTIIIFVAQKIISTDIFSNLATEFAYDMMYGVPLFLPWVCFGLMRECQKWIRDFFRHERIPRNFIRPI